MDCRHLLPIFSDVAPVTNIQGTTESMDRAERTIQAVARSHRLHGPANLDGGKLGRLGMERELWLVNWTASV